MTDAWRRYLAAAQVAGGVAGFFGLRVWQALDARGLPPAAGALAALYFALSVAAGLLLWRRHPAGVPLSLAVQLPQLVVAVGPEANLLVLAGAYIRVLLPGSGFSIGAGAGGLFDATLLTGPVAGHVGASLDVGFRQRLTRGEEFRAYGVNALALVAAWKLARAWTADPNATARAPDAAAAEISAPVV
jgi:hypothetical protein